MQQLGYASSCISFSLSPVARDWFLGLSTQRKTLGLPSLKAAKDITVGLKRNWRSMKGSVLLAQSHASHSRFCCMVPKEGADVRYLTHSAIEGGRTRLKQSKTSTAVNVPVVGPLREALEACPCGGIFPLENRNVGVYSAKGFQNLIKRACIKAELPHCSAHGLRKSAAARLRTAGCTDQEGMAITGHKSVSVYRAYAGNAADAKLADAAMERTYGSQMSNSRKNLDTA